MPQRADSCAQYDTHNGVPRDPGCVITDAGGRHAPIHVSHALAVRVCHARLVSDEHAHHRRSTDRTWTESRHVVAKRARENRRRRARRQGRCVLHNTATRAGSRQLQHNIVRRLPRTHPLAVDFQNKCFAAASCGLAKCVGTPVNMKRPMYQIASFLGLQMVFTGVKMQRFWDFFSLDLFFGD